MSTLTPKQEHFAHCIADGMSRADAYRAAFKVRPATKPETCQASGSRLMADPAISSRVRELQSDLAAKNLWTREESVKTLAFIARGNDETAKASDRVSAVKELNAMHGWNSKQVIDLTNSDGSMRPTQILLVAAGADDDDSNDSAPA